MIAPMVDKPLALACAGPAMMVRAPLDDIDHTASFVLLESPAQFALRLSLLPQRSRRPQMRPNPR